MSLPFTVAQFLDVFRRYHEAVGPARWVLLALGLAAVALATRRGARAGRTVALILAALWLWMGAVYHLGFFRAINPAATLFGAAFLAQGVLLAWLGAGRGRVTFAPRADGVGIAGAALVLYALVLYPIAGAMAGHRHPAAPTFGLPCPTTILTIGLLLRAVPDAPRVLLVIPLLWAVVGTSAALQLGMYEDLGLPLAAIVAVAALLRPSRRGLAPAPAS